MLPVMGMPFRAVDAVNPMCVADQLGVVTNYKRLKAKLQAVDDQVRPRSGLVRAL
jgi:hypothetical protein